MTRRLLAVFVVTAAVFALTVRADDPTAKPADPKAPAAAVDPTAKQPELVAKEKKLREQFEAFENEVIKLKDRLATSDKEEDRQTVQVLQRVLTEIDALKVKQKFHDVDALLSDATAIKSQAQKAGDAAKDNAELHEAMKKLIAILDNLDDADSEKHKKIEENIKLLQRLQEALVAQQRQNTQIDRNQKSGADLAKQQDKIGQQIKSAMGDPGAKKPDFNKSEAKYDNKPGPNNKSEAKNDTEGPKGEAKDGKQADPTESKPGQDKTGENKDGMKPAEGKDGENKDGMKPSDGKTGENKDGMKPGEAKTGENKDGGDKPSESKDGKAGGDKSGKPGEAKDAGAKPDNKEAKPGESKDGKGGDAKDGKPGDGKDGPKQEANKSEGKPGDKGGDDKDGKPGEGKPGDKAGQPKDGKAGDNKEGKAGESKDGKGGDSKDGKSGESKDGAKGGENKPSAAKDGAKSGDNKDGKPGEGKQASASDPNGKPGEAKEGSKPGAANGKPGGQPKEGAKPGDGKPGEAKAGDGKGDSKPGTGKGNEAKTAAGAESPKPGAGKPGSQGDGKPGKPGDAKEGKPSDGKAGAGKPGEAKDGKPGGGKPSDGKPSDPKSDSKGKGDGKADAKAGDPKSGMSGDGKPSESKGNPSSGQPSQGQPSQGKGDSSSSGGDSPPQPPQPEQKPIDPNVRKKIEDGAKDSDATKDKLNENDKPGALPPAGKTADDIKQAIKKLEEIINQDRQEEIDRILERLQARCARMLAWQIDVRDQTASLDKEVTDARLSKNEEAMRKADQKAIDLATSQAEAKMSEQKIIDEADRTLALLDNDGTAVAFAEMFTMVRQDMGRVQKRLNETDTGKVTVAIEDDIIGHLKDMVDALKKQREANKNKQNQQQQPKQPGQPRQPGEDPLVDVIAQLKLLRSMQEGINKRTELYHNEYQGEQAPVPGDGKTEKEKAHYKEIQDEMRDLADTEARIGKILKDLLTGKTRVD